MKINTLISFVVGATVGSVATFVLISKKYQKMYEEDVASVKAECKKDAGVTITNEEIKPKFTKEESTQYVKIVQDESYSSENTENENYVNYSKKPAPNPNKPKPQVISKEEFGIEDDYDIYTLLYFADNVLTDDDNIPVDNIEDTVGEDAIKHFGEDVTDPDTVYVVNHEKECYYEILADERDFVDLLTPPQR